MWSASSAASAGRITRGSLGNGNHGQIHLLHAGVSLGYFKREVPQDDHARIGSFDTLDAFLTDSLIGDVRIIDHRCEMLNTLF